MSSACINSHSERGVEARWKDLAPDTFERGETTRSQVMDTLGPPSQILTTSEETVLYYMLESIESSGLVLLVYNSRKERATYERAVFFFDAQQVLTDYAFSE